MNKPDILRDEQIQAIKHYRDWTGGIVLAEDRPLCQAQLDADVAYYEQKIAEIFEEIERDAVVAPFHKGQPETLYWQMSTEEWQSLKSKWGQK